MARTIAATCGPINTPGAPPSQWTSFSFHFLALKVLLHVEIYLLRNLFCFVFYRKIMS